ncbi:hypothetical protein, partial [Clostridium perfringens]
DVDGRRRGPRSEQHGNAPNLALNPAVAADGMNSGESQARAMPCMGALQLLAFSSGHQRAARRNLPPAAEIAGHRA